MITIPVKTLFQGDVGIRDRYIKEAKDTGQSITVVREDGAMLIPNNEMKARCKGRSKKKFMDRFGRDGHYLYYFNWKPDATQRELL
jgi:hypothetical protein